MYRLRNFCIATHALPLPLSGGGGFAPPRPIKRYGRRLLCRWKVLLSGYLWADINKCREESAFATRRWLLDTSVLNKLERLEFRPVFDLSHINHFVRDISRWTSKPCSQEIDYRSFCVRFNGLIIVSEYLLYLTKSNVTWLGRNWLHLANLNLTY